MLDGAVRGEISSLPYKMELVDVDRLIGDREANRILIVQLDVFDVEGQGGQSAIQHPLPEVAERARRSAEARRPRNGR